MPAILFKPREASAANPVPAVVYVHGGPGGQNRRGYSAMDQHLVNHGYAVYAINNRGSSGYGKTFLPPGRQEARRRRSQGRRRLEGFPAVARLGPTTSRSASWAAPTAATWSPPRWPSSPQAFDAGINIFGVTNWVRTLELDPAVVGVVPQVPL